MHPYRILSAYAAPHKAGWIAILLVTLLSTLFRLLEPWPMKVLVDHVLGAKPLTGGFADVAAWLPGTATRTGLLAWVVAATLFIFAFNSAIGVLSALLWTRVGRATVYELARDLFARVQRRSLLFHARRPVGDTMSRITADSWAVHTVVDTLLFAPGHTFFTIAAIVVVMLKMDPWLTLLALGVAPFMSVSGWFFGRRVKAAARAKREIESRIQSHVQQTLTGIPVVQAFTREDAEQARFQEYAAEAIKAHRRGAFLGSSYGLASGLIGTAGTALVLWLAAMRVLRGELTIGLTLVFMSYLRHLQGQIHTFINIYTTMQSAGAGIDRVMELLSPPDDLPTTAARRLPRVSGEVAFERVTFGYTAGEPVLTDVSLVAKPGDTVAIVGPTGAGKTTLMSLVPRFFDPWSGSVRIDGIDARELDRQDLRSNVALVLQEPFLFPFTVAENIAYGRPNATRDEIEAAARAANADGFIEQLPEGYDTVIGERGSTLSGGERQRISIARALLKDAPILILDEPTSALDAETEALLLQALERLMKGRTTFIIAHRLSTIRRATQIVVLEQGRVVERGSPRELLDRRGRYHRLHALQFDETTAGLPAA